MFRPQSDPNYVGEVRPDRRHQVGLKPDQGRPNPIPQRKRLQGIAIPPA